ncbi:MAG TPA: hypothetical protein VFP65_03370 [Anaeromyxobacteraceae bacterium]|nr:hypothetical protein [Anaeromyxobacteraceae bacterium]
MDPAEIDTAWSELQGRWEDDAAHRAFLARFADLDALAEAGRRYRAALEARPGDPVALRWRDEVVKRATVIAMAQLPRTKPPRQLPPRLRRALVAAAFAATAATVGWSLLRMSGVVGAPR